MEAQTFPRTSFRDGGATRMKGEVTDDNMSDSGVSMDFSPGSTGELCPSIPPPSPPPLANETPIEREIRKAMEREQSLRLARGLHRPQEFVEVPLRRRPLLFESPPAKSDKSQGKDRQFAGKKMLREISVETQREQDLVEQGTVPGFYDKGTVRELRERKLLFEAFQEPQEPSSQSRRQPSGEQELPGEESAASSFSEWRRSPEMVTQGQSSPEPEALDEGFTYVPHTFRRPRLSEETGGRVIILENHAGLSAPAPHQGGAPHIQPAVGPVTEVAPLTTTDSGSVRAWEENRLDSEEEEGVQRENPFFKLRSSMALRPDVEQDIREARERERELRRQRSSLYQEARSGEKGSPASTRVPIPAQNQPVHPVLTTKSTSAKSGPAPKSQGKLGFTWPPPQADEGQGSSQAEAVRSPRTPRQKTPLLQRWESGLVNSHEED